MNFIIEVSVFVPVLHITSTFLDSKYVSLIPDCGWLLSW